MFSNSLRSSVEIPVESRMSTNTDTFNMQEWHNLCFTSCSNIFFPSRYSATPSWPVCLKKKWPRRDLNAPKVKKILPKRIRPMMTPQFYIWLSVNSVPPHCQKVDHRLQRQMPSIWRTLMICSPITYFYFHPKTLFWIKHYDRLSRL